MKNRTEETVYHTPEYITEKTTAPQTSHCVFVTDNQGIRDIFPLLKFQMGAEKYTHLTLLYYTSQTSEPLFKAELENLEKRFTQKLQVVYHTLPDPIQIEKSAELHLQEKLEEIINKNVCQEMQFLLWGADDLIEVIYERLVFLGISKKIIHIQLTF